MNRPKKSGAARRALPGATMETGEERLAASETPQPDRAAGGSFAYVGCYTTAKRYARGDGIHVYRVDEETGDWSPVQRLGNLTNPSFLVLSRDQRYLYSVHGDETYASSFSVDRESGCLTPLNCAETGGRNGVYQAIDPSGRFMLVANYSSGNVAVLPVREDGTLGEHVHVVPLEGQPGPHRIEQTSSHPHQVVFDPAGRFVMVPDKGLDRIFVFRFDPNSGRLTPTEQGSVTAPPGSGPRHAAFHPTLPIIWVINEISNTVVTYYLEAEHGGLRPVQILPSLPSDYVSENTGSGIAVTPGGRFVYCSNRTHDSIAMFAADPETGLLTSIGWMPSRGRIPRFIGFEPSGRFLYAGNEQSDTVVSWRADSATGLLTPTRQVVRNASPSTIAFACRQG
ncbi:MAG: lactonase family protein [Proteobacteria bacterium]|nr:lactonase family protein [Pseudomonadota bacterium]